MDIDVRWDGMAVASLSAGGLCSDDGDADGCAGALHEGARDSKCGSRYKGLTPDKRRRSWRVRINYRGRRIYLGK
jgi:hypothetical protein